MPLLCSLRSEFLPKIRFCLVVRWNFAANFPEVKPQSANTPNRCTLIDTLWQQCQRLFFGFDSELRRFYEVPY